MDTKGGKPRGGGDGGVLNWAIGIDMYTLMCIKLMTNKNLLYKKINKIQKLKKNHEWHMSGEEVMNRLFIGKEEGKILICFKLRVVIIGITAKKKEKKNRDRVNNFQTGRGINGM